MTRMKTWFVCFAMVFALGGVAFAQEPPAPGTSPRVDAIRKAGVLRVGDWLTSRQP